MSPGELKGPENNYALFLEGLIRSNDSRSSITAEQGKRCWTEENKLSQLDSTAQKVKHTKLKCVNILF